MSDKNRLRGTIVWKKILPPSLTAIMLLALWQAAVSFGWVYEWLVPAPFDVVRESVNIAPRLAAHTWSTLQLTATGFMLGSLAGFLIAALLHMIPIVRSALYPFLILTQNIPIVVLAPMITMLLGYGFLPKAILVTLVCFFPVSVAMLNGLANTDPVLRNYMQMIGSSDRQLFWQLELPYAMSHLFSGLKIAATYSMLSAVVAEWLSPKEGLGGFLVMSARNYLPARVFAAVLIIALVSLLLFAVVEWAERYLIRWRPKREGGKG